MFNKKTATPLEKVIADSKRATDVFVSTVEKLSQINNEISSSKDTVDEQIEFLKNREKELQQEKKDLSKVEKENLALIRNINRLFE